MLPKKAAARGQQHVKIRFLFIEYAAGRFVGIDPVSGNESPDRVPARPGQIGVFALQCLQYQALAPRSSLLAIPRGERDLLLSALRVASAEARLIANQIDTIGASLRQKLVNCEGALRWARDEGLAHLIKFGPEARS